MGSLSNAGMPPRYRRKLNGVVPWGYKVDKNDPLLLVQIPEQMEALQMAFDYLKVSSYREVAKWLSDYTGRKMSYVQLFRLHKECMFIRKYLKQHAEYMNELDKPVESTQNA